MTYRLGKIERLLFQLDYEVKNTINPLQLLKNVNFSIKTTND